MKHALLNTSVSIALVLLSVTTGSALAHDTTIVLSAPVHFLQHAIYFGTITVALFSVILFVKIRFLRKR